MGSKFTPAPVRLRQVALALEVDRVLTLAQVVRHYEVREEPVLSHFPHREVQFKPLSNSSPVKRTTFIAREPERLLWEPAWSLAHDAGTAELRYLLGASRQEWERAQGYGTSRPDALWRRPGGQVVAVEYDGGYPPAITREKFQAFSDRRTFQGLVWGTPSRARTAHLAERHGGAGRSFLVVDITTATSAGRAATATAGGGRTTG